MNNIETHMHAVLKRGVETQVSFIPSKFAERGRFLKLKEDGVWVDGWEVMEVYAPQIPSTIVAERSRDHANHRKATDI